MPVVRVSALGGVPISYGDLPIICRDIAGIAVYGGVIAKSTSTAGNIMAEVIGFGRMRPNGAKIVELRKRRGMKQEVLADNARISERQLREIERTNKPTHATTITAIATALGATAREITLSTPDEEPEKSGPLLKLEAIQSAKNLAHIAQSADDYGYLLKVDPSVETAAEMQELMTIVRHYVTGQPDEFAKVLFGDIPRLARLHQLLEKLRAGDVGVLAGTIVIAEHDLPHVPRSISGDGKRALLLIFFQPIAVKEEVISMDLIVNWLDNQQFPF